jgi:hypothetical protein
MTLGFIMIRNVKDKKTDLFWRECYKCIRNFYDSPIIIVDTGSDRNFISENIKLKNTTVIYHETTHYIGELLGYYYFWKLKPFDQAVILQDSVFLQKYVDFFLKENEHVKIFWNFAHNWDANILDKIQKIISSLNKSEELNSLYNQKQSWCGAFGSMAVIRWDFLDTINTKHGYFDNILPIIKEKLQGCALERVTGLLFFYNSTGKIPVLFGDIHKYCRWGITYSDYLTRKYSDLPILKIWANRQ